MNEELKIDLSDLELEDIEIFLQEGSRAMPDFAASTGTHCTVAAHVLVRSSRTHNRY